MKTFSKIMARLGRHRVIMDRQNDEPYLERYYIFLRDRTWFPFNVFIHKFLKSDPTDVHDHPWPYATLILRGGYWEWVPVFNNLGQQISEVRYWRGAGHFRICKAKSYHRIELEPDVTAWTMFMPGPQYRNWGFLVNNRWVAHDQYLEAKHEKA
jgi:hypothetical protein